MSSLALVFVLLAGLCSGAPKNARIIGGNPANIENYPSIVQIEMIYRGYWAQICGGNIVNNFYVLTAAYCFTYLERGRDSPIRVEDYRIRAGSKNFESGGVLHEVTTVKIHPDFVYDYPQELSLNADIALVRLRSSFSYSSAVQRTPIVPQNYVVPDDASAVYVGWGNTETGTASPVLLDVQVKTVKHSTCVYRHATAEHPLAKQNVTENMICAGLLNVGGKSACFGDTGGPLYYGGVLVGIISMGGSTYCAHPYVPELNTKVASYTNWIVANAV